MAQKTIALLKSSLDRVGGAEKYSWRLIAALQERGCSVTVFTTGASPLYQNQQLLSFKTAPTSRALTSVQQVHSFDRFCQDELQKSSYDVVFGLDRNSFQTHIRASNGVHAAYLDHRKRTSSFCKRLSFSFNPLHKALLAIEKRSFTHPQLQKIIANSHMVKQEIVSHYQVDPEKISVVHNGVEWHQMAQPFANWQQQREVLCQSLGLDHQQFHLLFIGNNYRRKGLEPLLKGMALLKTAPLHLSVVGKEKEIGYFKRLCRKLGLEQKVSFWEQTSDIYPFYQLADALAIPSYYDPFANVTVEALAMGLFVISSTTNGGNEVLQEGKTGTLLSSLYDPQSVKNSLEIALQHPKTPLQAETIRNSVQRLDFSSQLGALLEILL